MKQKYLKLNQNSIKQHDWITSLRNTPISRKTYVFIIAWMFKVIRFNNLNAHPHGYIDNHSNCVLIKKIII